MGAALMASVAAVRLTACPCCGSSTARADLDMLGRRVVICRCHGGAFLAPPNVAIAIVPTTTRIVARRQSSGKPRWCPNDCGRAVGPRQKHCNVCAPIVAATRYACPGPGCRNTINHKQHRCETCKARYDHDRAAERWQRQKASRTA